MRCYILSIIALITLAQGCIAQNKSENSCSDIIYKSSPIPYKVANPIDSLSLPDSLLNGRKGNIVLGIFLTKEGKIEGCNLIFLNLKGDSDNLKYYKFADKILFENEYPQDVRHFVPFFKNFVEKITIERNQDVSLIANSKYLIYIPLKL